MFRRLWRQNVVRLNLLKNLDVLEFASHQPITGYRGAPGQFFDLVNGDVAVFLSEANVLVMGDLFTHRTYPVIDESSGGSLRGMIEAIERLLPMIDRDTLVVPGHGAVTNRTGLTAFLDMLRSIEDRILVLIEAQREIPEITAARPTAEFDSVWGRGYVTGAHFTRMALAGMGKAPCQDCRSAEAQAPLGPVLAGHDDDRRHGPLRLACCAGEPGESAARRRGR